MFEYRDQLVSDSRDVAAMTGRQHKDTLRTVSTMCKHLTGRKIALSFTAPRFGVSIFRQNFGVSCNIPDKVVMPFPSHLSHIPAAYRDSTE